MRDSKHVGFISLHDVAKVIDRTKHIPEPWVHCHVAIL